jgi:D-alanyl-D-alanine carboxypeptidase (penicillin-binding protein 5/6)
MTVQRFCRLLRRRRLAVILAGLVALSLCGGASAETVMRPWLYRQYRFARPLVTPVRVTATAAIVMDARTGQVLYSRNAHLIWPPASTTKILTALVALERAPLGTSITISPEVARFRVGSVVGLPAGARISLHDLLYALLLPSGNDVALAIAEGVAGNVSTFVAQMNDTAYRLGARQTHFTSPHGLYDPNHYTTVYDLALIARAAMAEPTFREIVRTERWTFEPPGARARVLTNHNRMLWWYPGADGVKTGYVNMSGETLVESATRNGWRLIVVEFHSADIWGDASRLLTYGFGHYRAVELARAGEEMAAVELPGTRSMVVGVTPDAVYGDVSGAADLSRHVEIEPHLATPVHPGERLGTVDFYDAGRLLRSAPIVALSTAGAASPGPVARIISWVKRAIEAVVAHETAPHARGPAASRSD